jgi:hypothetical protein
MMKYVPVIMLCLFATGAQAQPAGTEEEYFRRSRFCEGVTRLPWGDVDERRWFDCVAYLRIPTAKQQEEEWEGTRKVQAAGKWTAGYLSSRVGLAEEGCSDWAKTQPKDDHRPDPYPPGCKASCVFTYNRAWNLCMQRQGIFIKTQ